MKFIFILAVILGIYWCISHLDYSAMKSAFIDHARSGSIVRSVNDGRAKVYNDSTNVMHNN